MRFQDSEGVSFNNTFLFNGGTEPQALDCGVTGALILNDNVVINGNLTVRGSIYASDNYQSCMMIMPSDARVKHQVRGVDKAKLYDRITNMPLKTFRYTDEYLNSHGRPAHLRNTTYVGVIAQEIAKDFEYAVSKTSAKIGAFHLPDMHHIHPELLFGEVVGALQHMRHLHEQIVHRVHALEGQASRLASETVKESGAVLRATMATGRKAMQEMSKQAERGHEAVTSVDTHIHKALSYLNERIRRLERAVTD